MIDASAILESATAHAFEVAVQLPLEMGGRRLTTRPPPPLTALDGPTGARVWSLVGILGEKRYCVMLECAEALARRIAEAILGEDMPEWSVAVEDAMGELANIIGGNVKAMLPEQPLRLSLPSVIHGRETYWSAPKMHVIGKLGFLCEGHHLLVTLGDDLPAAPSV